MYADVQWSANNYTVSNLFWCFDILYYKIYVVTHTNYLQLTCCVNAVETISVLMGNTTSLPSDCSVTACTGTFGSGATIRSIPLVTLVALVLSVVAAAV